MKLKPILLGLAGALITSRVLRAARAEGFAERVVVITGGSRGLGLVLARQLAGAGARLAILARDPAELDRAVADLQQAGAEVRAYPCDVGDRGQVDATIELILEHFGRIDVVINNAGIIQVGPLEHQSLGDFEEAMAVHFWGPLYITQAVLPHMRSQGGGRIVNISSIGGLVAVPHLLPYVASKHALVGLSNGLRAELAASNIRITTVCPGLMRTGSPYNALFKGQHRREFTWFTLFDALPVSSIDARRAAAQIIDACRHGDPELTITFQARALVLTQAVAPGLVARGMQVFNRLQPGPDGSAGDELRRGIDSQSRLAPSLLTRLADQAALRNNEVQDPGAFNAHGS